MKVDKGLVVKVYLVSAEALQLCALDYSSQLCGVSFGGSPQPYIYTVQPLP